jgi:hypothetical protein
MRIIISLMLCFLLISCSKKDEQLKKIGQDLKETEKKLEQEKKDLESVSKQKEEELKKAKEDYDKAVEENNKTGKYPGKFPFASMKELTNDDLKGLSELDKKIMKSEILARYGFIFKDKEMKDYFSEQKWYKPKNKNVDNMLTELEKRNMEFIK